MEVMELREKQRKALSILITRQSACITGPAGTGKTEVIKRFVNQVKSSGLTVAVTSTTGSSALLIGGTTLHSYLGIGYGTAGVDVLHSKIMSWPWLRTRWRKLDVLIIDEISMLNPELFDKLEVLARMIRGSPRPFGGLQIVLSGDFCQLPAVGCDKMCFEAESWSKAIKNTVYLDEIIRQRDPLFQEILLKIRLGVIDRQVKDVIKSRVAVPLENDLGIKPTRLYCRNVNVDIVNNAELATLIADGRESHVFTMKFTFEPCVSNVQLARERFLKNCSAKERLEICVDAQVILLKNLDLTLGLANGSRGVVTAIRDGFPMVRFLSGEERYIGWHVWDVEENDKPYLSARQLPLKVAYAVSIHSSQGLSLDYVSIDLSDVFEYGQAYTGLSRVRSLEGLCVERVHFLRLKAHPTAVAFYRKLSRPEEITNENDSICSVQEIEDKL